MGETAVRLSGVTKTFGATVAVKDLELAVPRGGLWGFIGPNGAGKTTTIRMIMAILFPDRGSIEVLGRATALEAKDRIGYLPEERGVYKKMRVGAFLAYMARLKGHDGDGVRRRVREWLERVGLGNVEKARCEELSKGMQQKIQFISTVIHEPELLILDEPFSGLDPVNMRLLRDLVQEQHQRGATILFSTHVMAQAEHLCDHVLMIHRGEKVLDEAPADIRRRFDPHTLELEPLDPDARPESLESLDVVRTVARRGNVWEVSLEPEAEVRVAIPAVVARVPAARVELRRPSLEDVFVQMVAGSGDGAEGLSVADLRNGGEVAS